MKTIIKLLKVILSGFCLILVINFFDALLIGPHHHKNVNTEVDGYIQGN